MESRGWDYRNYSHAQSAACHDFIGDGNGGFLPQIRQILITVIYAKSVPEQKECFSQMEDDGKAIEKEMEKLGIKDKDRQSSDDISHIF